MIPSSVTALGIRLLYIKYLVTQPFGSGKWMMSIIRHPHHPPMERQLTVCVMSILELYRYIYIIPITCIGFTIMFFFMSVPKNSTRRVLRSFRLAPFLIASYI